MTIGASMTGNAREHLFPNLVLNLILKCTRIFFLGARKNLPSHIPHPFPPFVHCRWQLTSFTLEMLEQGLCQ